MLPFARMRMRVYAHNAQVSLDDLSSAELRELVMADRKRLADLKTSRHCSRPICSSSSMLAFVLKNAPMLLRSKEQAKQIKDLKDLLSGKEQASVCTALPLLSAIEPTTFLQAPTVGRYLTYSYCFGGRARS